MASRPSSPCGKQPAGIAVIRFDGKVVIVTGGGRGLGRSYALLLAELGAAVVVNDVGARLDGAGATGDPAHEVVEEIQAVGGQAIPNVDSVATGSDSVVAAAVDAFGRVDVVINNAGFEQAKPFGDNVLDDLRRYIDVHFLGTAGVTLAAWPHLAQSGAGRVVNTVSTTMYGMPKHTGYGAAKAAIFGFTRSLALDGAALHIKANCIAPAAGTRMSDGADVSDDQKAMMRERMPASLVSPVVAYLASKACAVSGETLAVGAGTCVAWCWARRRDLPIRR